MEYGNSDEDVMGDSNTVEDVNDDLGGGLKGELDAGKVSCESDNQEKSEMEYKCLSEERDAQPGTSGDKMVVIKRESFNDLVKPSCSLNN